MGVHFFIHNTGHAGDVVLSRILISEIIETFPDVRITLECKAKDMYLWEDFGCPIIPWHDDVGRYVSINIKTPKCPVDAVFMNLWPYAYNTDLLFYFGLSYLLFISIFNSCMAYYGLDMIYRLEPKNKPSLVTFRKKTPLSFDIERNGVLVENGEVFSNQSTLPLNDHLKEMSEEFPGLIFYCSAPPSHSAANIIDVSRLNLLELSELSGRVLALLTRASGVNAATMTETNRFKLRCFAGTTKSFADIFRFADVNNNPIFAPTMVEVKKFLSVITQNIDILKQQVDDPVPFERDRGKYLSRNGEYSTCKFLLSVDEAKDSISYLTETHLPLHQEPFKCWDTANIIYELSDGNLLDMGSSDSFILKTAIYHHIKGEKYAIDLRPPTEVFPGVRYMVGNCCDTALPDEFFQNITCLSVLEHGVDFSAFATETARLLKPGGRLYITFDYWEPKITHDVKMFGLNWSIFDKNEVLALISECESRGLYLLDDIDWELKEPVYKSPYGPAYTFGMLAFVKMDETAGDTGES